MRCINLPPIPHYWSKLIMHVRILLITKKLYSIQNRPWHKNVEKDSFYHIRVQLYNNYLIIVT